MFTGTGGHSAPARTSRRWQRAIPTRSESAATTIAPMGPSRLRLTKPVIAAVEGHAVAGGMELALRADLRVVAEDATFGIFFRRFGVPLDRLKIIGCPA